MNKKPIFFQICEYKNEVDLVDKVLMIYSIVKKDGNLRKFERDVLNYYIRNGIDDNNKDEIKEELGLKTTNLTQANYFLRNKGYLVKDKKNHNKNELNLELQDIRKAIVINGKRIYATGFKQK